MSDRLIVALAATIMFAPVCAYGQAVNATLLGTVTDSTGATGANAKITITEFVAPVKILRIHLYPLLSMLEKQHRAPGPG